MAEKDLPVEYTDVNYASKSDISRIYNSTLITDSIWGKVVDYRKKYRYTLSITDFRKINFYITLTPSLKSRINNICNAITSWLEDVDILKNSSEYSFKKFAHSNYVSILNTILDGSNESFANTIADGAVNNLRGLDEDKNTAIGYFVALQEAGKKDEEIDEDFIINVLMHIARNYELVSLYRTKEYNSRFSTIGYEYVGAPINYIEYYMIQLINFINASDNTNYLIKAIAAYVCIQNIKPFDKHNAKVASMLFKGVLNNNLFNKNIYLLPIEKLFVENNKLNQAFKESVKTCDLTYVIDVLLNGLENLLHENTLNIKRINLNEAIEEKRQIDEEEIAAPQYEEVKEEYVQEVQSPQYEEVKEEYNPPVEPSYNEEVSYEAEQHEQTPQYEEIKNEEHIKEEKIEQPTEIYVQKEEKVAPAYKKEKEIVPTVNIQRHEQAMPTHIATIDEKDALKFEEYLLESDPMLRKTQAHFYARHCSLGKYYSIQQFKKCEKVVYETARTSMDMLAKLGYYKKEQIKNKFVYTPIERK